MSQLLERIQDFLKWVSYMLLVFAWIARKFRGQEENVFAARSILEIFRTFYKYLRFLYIFIRKMVLNFLWQKCEIGETVLNFMSSCSESY